MKFVLYIELGTRVQDARVLDLLRFPSASAFAGETKWSAEWWSRGRTKRMTLKDREKLLQKVAAEGLNYLQLKCRTSAVSKTPKQKYRITDAWLWFNPSPTCELWAPVPTAPVINHAEERRRQSFVGGEPYRHKYRLPYPTVLECCELTIETNEGGTDSALQALSIDLIRGAIPPELAKQDIFGYGCLWGVCRRQMMLHSLGGVSAWIDQLGVKFENIYPILIGPRQSCEGLVDALPGRSSLIPIADGAASAIVSILPDKVPEIRQDPRVREWVVMRDLRDLNATPEVVEEIFKKQSAISAIAPFLKR